MSDKKYRIEYMDSQSRKHFFVDTTPYNFIIYNPSDGVMVNARELEYGKSGWLIADEMGCHFTLAKVMEIDDRIWKLANNEHWHLVLYYRNQEIWHDDNPANKYFDALTWINANQPDVPQEQIDLWLKQEQSDYLDGKHLLAIRSLYGDDDDS